jgi:transposase
VDRPVRAQVLVAVEDCRHLTPRFEVDLLTAGHQVVRVHTRLMAGARRSVRERGKPEARAALREPELPRDALDGLAHEVKVSADYRSQLVQQRTKVTNRLSCFLHQLDPELAVPARAELVIGALRLLGHLPDQQLGEKAAYAVGILAWSRTGRGADRGHEEGNGRRARR